MSDDGDVRKPAEKIARATSFRGISLAISSGRPVLFAAIYIISLAFLGSGSRHGLMG